MYLLTLLFAFDKFRGKGHLTALVDIAGKTNELEYFQSKLPKLSMIQVKTYMLKFYLVRQNLYDSFKQHGKFSVTLSETNKISMHRLQSHKIL